MANFLRGLGQLATVAGATVHGYDLDRKQAVADALAQRKQDDEERRNKVLNALGDAQRTKLLAPPAQDLVTSVGPTGKRVRAVDAPGVEVPGEDRTPLVTAVGPHGESVRAVDAPGVVVPSTTPKVPLVTGEGGIRVADAPGVKVQSPAGEGKLTEPQEKSYLFYNLMKNSEPTITEMQSKKTIRPAAISTYLSAEAAGNIPVIGGVVGSLAKPAANENLNADEQRLIRAGKDFTAGVLRKESGAAVTPKELVETMERYFPGMFGDKPALTADKTTARNQYMETMRQEASPAIEYFAKRPAATAPQRRSTDKTPTKKSADDYLRAAGVIP
jgi:hypothetical protein